jgi:hypothetical protein
MVGVRARRHCLQQSQSGCVNSPSRSEGGERSAPPTPVSANRSATPRRRTILTKMFRLLRRPDVRVCGARLSRGRGRCRAIAVCGGLRCRWRPTLALAPYFPRLVRPYADCFDCRTKLLRLESCSISPLPIRKSPCESDRILSSPRSIVPPCGCAAVYVGDRQSGLGDYYGQVCGNTDRVFINLGFRRKLLRWGRTRKPLAPPAKAARGVLKGAEHNATLRSRGVAAASAA